jgi:hypothetical protein
LALKVVHTWAQECSKTRGESVSTNYVGIKSILDALKTLGVLPDIPVLTVVDLIGNIYLIMTRIPLDPSIIFSTSRGSTASPAR